MAVASTVRCHTAKAVFTSGAVNEVESFTAALKRAHTSNSSIDKVSTTGAATLAPRKQQTERRPAAKELEAPDSREGAYKSQTKAAASALKKPSADADASESVTRKSHTTSKTVKFERRSGVDAANGGRKRRPYQAGDLREAARQLAMATMSCEDYMQRAAIN